MDIWPGRSDESFERVQEAMMESGLGDGLPIVAPTADRVERMLAHRWFDPDEVLCQLAPLFASVTWRDVAINAVMAGCKPEYLAIVGAAVEAMAEPEFNLIGISTTTGSAATMVIVNGPIARAAGMNSDANALGPGNRANATIGRAVRLVLQNVGGARAGEIDMATIGQPAKFTFCVAENEAQSAWPPLHVERGFARGQSVVTVVGTAGIVEVVDSSSRTTDELAQTFAQSMLIAGTVGGGGLLGGGEPLLVIPPELVTLVSTDGRTKMDFKRAIFERATLPVDRLSPPIREHLTGRRGADADGEPAAPLKIAERAEDVMLVVAGGVGIKAAYIPTWGGSTRAVSRVVRGS
jgi:hypothetical protein